ncbi:MAG: polysaccharide biosynthesis protein [Tenericutes bacterium]|nr:polysaccharide biosynthesis protein [Mycoplasmatota bacterium]
MKKNGFVEGTFIATFAIIIVKVLGALYVIPFYRIIGESGGALYSYAYNVYNLFLNISTAGIPIAISKLISEYNTLEMYEAKERAYKLGRNIILIISVIAFFMLFVFSREFASLILGEIKGGNTLDDVSFVIKCVSFCLLIIPFLSVSKGYLQGHKYITPSSISQVIEQVVRIAVLLMGSYIVINVLNKSVTLGVGVSVFAAFVGGCSAYLYIKIKMIKNKSAFPTKNTKDNVSNKEIFKKILKYSIPIIIVSVATDIYSLTDMTLVVRTSYKLGYTAKEAELIASIISTWAPKICMIINAVAIGMGTSLIPHMVSSYTKKDYTSSNKRFNEALRIIIVSTLPLAVGLAFLSEPVYTLFYGNNTYGTLILRYTSISSFFASIYIVISLSLQSLNKFKTVYVSSIMGFLINALLDVPLMHLFNLMGLEAFYGAILATILGYVFSYIYSLTSLKRSMNFNYSETLDTIKKVFLPITSMFIVLVILNLFVKLPTNGIMRMCLVLGLYTLLGAFVYLGISYKTGLLYEVFGKDYVDNLLRKLHLKRRL